MQHTRGDTLKITGKVTADGSPVNITGAEILFTIRNNKNKIGDPLEQLTATLTDEENGEYLIR
jgi:hypothetical protein